MTITIGEYPSAHREDAGTFPGSAEFATVWDQLDAESSAWATTDTTTYLHAWGGPAVATEVVRFAGVNHIGVYLGDYTNDDDVFAWHAYLKTLQTAGDIADLDMGPSYIAPRQYGTPGWWISLTLADHRVIETFTCRSFGRWLDRPVPERFRLMSHVALDVHTVDDVQSVLTALNRDADHLEAIAYTEADEMGHTYGHLRNNLTRSVLEIVYDEAKQRRLATAGTIR